MEMLYFSIIIVNHLMIIFNMLHDILLFVLMTKRLTLVHKKLFSLSLNSDHSI